MKIDLLRVWREVLFFFDAYNKCPIHECNMIEHFKTATCPLCEREKNEDI